MFLLVKALIQPNGGLDGGTYTALLNTDYIKDAVGHGDTLSFVGTVEDLMLVLKAEIFPRMGGK